METLLKLNIVVEPDLHRFGRFTLEAIAALQGNPFTATAALDDLWQHWRGNAGDDVGGRALTLALDEQRLYAVSGNQSTLLSHLAVVPAASDVAALAARLQQASEATDSALLQRRNQQISDDLARAKARAAAEMAELETALQKKKDELQESLRLAETDSLTGLLNRGAYDVRLQQAFLRCRRQNEPLCLLLLDLDKFKEINDTHGHQYGDAYLQRMAQAIAAAARAHVDHACRIGGDEFAIVLFADIAIAERVAAKVVAQMEQRVSIGIAQAQADDTVETLVGRADAALYQAKNQGRGRYVAAPPAAATAA